MTLTTPVKDIFVEVELYVEFGLREIGFSGGGFQDLGVHQMQVYTHENIFSATLTFKSKTRFGHLGHNMESSTS